MDSVMPEVRVQVADFVRTICDAAEAGDTDYIADCMNNFSEFITQAIVDGVCVGRTQTVVPSLN